MVGENWNPPQGECELPQTPGFYCCLSFHHNGPCACHPVPGQEIPGYNCDPHFGVPVPMPAYPAPPPAVAPEPLAPWDPKHSVWSKPKKTEQKSGGPTSYYLVNVSNPNQGPFAYQAECGDIIEALQMDFNQGCAFKAIWRSAAAKVLDVIKAGGDAEYDAEKVIFYGGRMLANLTGEKPIKSAPPTDKHEIQQRCKNLRRLLSDMTGKTVQPHNITNLLAEIDQLDKLAKD